MLPLDPMRRHKAAVVKQLLTSKKVGWWFNSQCTGHTRVLERHWYTKVAQLSNNFPNGIHGGLNILQRCLQCWSIMGIKARLMFQTTCVCITWILNEKMKLWSRASTQLSGSCWHVSQRAIVELGQACSLRSYTHLLQTSIDLKIRRTALKHHCWLKWFHRRQEIYLCTITRLL